MKKLQTFLLALALAAVALTSYGQTRSIVKGEIGGHGSTGTYANVKVDSNGVVSVTPAATTTGGYSFWNIVSSGTTTGKVGAGTLQSVAVNKAGDLQGSVTVYDALSAGSNTMAVINTGTISEHRYNAALSTGLTVVSSGTTTANITVTYK